MLIIFLSFQTPGLTQHLNVGQPEKKILVLFSLVPSTPAYRPILDGIRHELSTKYGDNFSLHIEYLETDRYPKGQYPQERFDVYNKKYAAVDVDLMICVGIDIVGTIRSLADEHLLNIPIVSLDYDFSKYGFPFDAEVNDKTTIIAVKVNIERSILTALELFPDTRNLYFVCGVAGLDRVFCTASRQAASVLNKNIRISIVTDLTMDETLRVLSGLPDSSLIIMTSFVQDADLVPYFNPEAARLFSKTAKVPVFTYTEMGFGEGIVGGYVIDFKKIGFLGGQSAVKVLEGAGADPVKYSEEDYYTCMFDDRQLVKWGIPTSRLPAGSEILYRESTFFERYRYLFIVGIFFLLLQSFLIFSLILMYRRQRKMAIRLQQAENTFRDMVGEDRILRTGQMTASLSHELNQPLTAILTTAQAGLRVLDDPDLDKELLKEILSNIVEDDKRTAAILSSIRGMMELEQREKEKVNINGLIEEMVIIYRSEAIKKNIRFETDLLPQPVHVLADKPQIQQVLMNFITNAFYATLSAGNSNSRVVISEAVSGSMVSVSVRDFGNGIDHALMDKVFKPFVTNKKEGLGIGLSISKSIIDSHQGKIWAENVDDGGAKFSFSLNIYQNE